VLIIPPLAASGLRASVRVKNLKEKVDTTGFLNSPNTSEAIRKEAGAGGWLLVLLAKQKYKENLELS
jgi:hypothetical protein